MSKYDDLDKKYRAAIWYLCGIGLMLGGMIWHWNMIMVGGGLLIFLIAVYIDADERGQVAHKKTKCDRCKHSFEERD